MLKKTLLALSIIVALTVTTLGWLTYTAANAKPNIAINYAQEITDLARRYQPESATQPNRRDEFVALLEDLEEIRSDFSALDRCRCRNPQSVLIPIFHLPARDPVGPVSSGPCNRTRCKH